VERLEPIGKLRREIEAIPPVRRRREEPRDGDERPRKQRRNRPVPRPPDDGRPHVDVRV